MKRRNRGFTLVELTFVIVVMLILAAMIIGGASYIMNQARGQTVVDQARQVRNAVENLMGRQKITRPPQPTDKDDFYNIMRSYMGTTTSTEFQVPYAGGAVERVNVLGIAGTLAGAVNAAWDANTDFPKTLTDSANADEYIGRVWYFYNTDNSNPPTKIKVFNGSELQEFNYFAVMAFDQEGAPLVTVGR